jgi:hypothetical protein
MKTLKQYTLLAFILFASLTKAQTLNFTYDAGGNMVQRQLQIVPPLPPGGGARFGTPISANDSTQVAPPINFKLFPNPASKSVTMEGDLPEGMSEVKFVVMNSTGQIVKQGIYSGKTQQLDVSDLKSGVYLIDLQYSKKQRSTYRLIINN